jgi:drug/metabolite transporter (DMT)-like permease
MTKIRLAALALFGVGFLWAAAFVLMKDAVQQQPYADFLATRFSIAFIAMLILRPRIATTFEKGDIAYGAVLGIFLALGYITQTIGLALTTAATSGFLTGLYVIFTPLIAWLARRERVSKRVAFGVLIALTGLAVFSGAAMDIEFQLGQIWLVVCAIFYAVHILLLSHHGRGRNSYRFAMTQIGWVAVVTWAFALLDGYQAPPNPEVWFALFFTALLSTVVAFWIQTWAQTLIDPARVALIITSEVVFTALLAVAVGQEPVTFAMVLGGGLLFAAMLIVEWPSRRVLLRPQTQLHE